MLKFLKRALLGCAALAYIGLVPAEAFTLQQFSITAANGVTQTVTATSYNLTTFTLPVGLWRCSADVNWTAAGTTQALVVAAFNTVSATLPATPPFGGYSQGQAGGSTSTVSVTVGPFYFNVPQQSTATSSAGTPLYLVTQSNFTGAAPKAWGIGYCEKAN